MVVVVGTLVLLANVLDRLGAGLSDGSGIAIVAVDANKVLAIGSLDIVDGDFSSTAVFPLSVFPFHGRIRGQQNSPILLAVATAAVKFSKVLNGESINGDGSNTIVLDNLVLSTAGTTADDLAIAVTLEGQRILAHSIPPHILNGASTKTVHTFILVLANDGVLEGSAVGKNEDGVFVAALGLASALDAAAVGLVAAVEGAGDGLGALVGYGAFAGGDGEGGGGAGAEGAEALGGGHGEQTGEDDGSVEVHDC